MVLFIVIMIKGGEQGYYGNDDDDDNWCPRLEGFYPIYLYVKKGPGGHDDYFGFE